MLFRSFRVIRVKKLGAEPKRLRSICRASVTVRLTIYYMKSRFSHKGGGKKVRS